MVRDHVYYLGYVVFWLTESSVSGTKVRHLISSVSQLDRVTQRTKIGPVGFLVMGNNAAVSNNIISIKYVDDMTVIEMCNKGKQRHMNSITG